MGSRSFRRDALRRPTASSLWGTNSARSGTSRAVFRLPFHDPAGGWLLEAGGREKCRRNESARPRSRNELRADNALGRFRRASACAASRFPSSRRSTCWRRPTTSSSTCSLPPLRPAPLLRDSRSAQLPGQRQERALRRGLRLLLAVTRLDGRDPAPPASLQAGAGRGGRAGAGAQGLDLLHRHQRPQALGARAAAAWPRRPRRSRSVIPSSSSAPAWARSTPSRPRALRSPASTATTTT